MASSALKLRDLKRTFITPEGVDLRLELGSAGSRAAAFMIDLVMMVVILLAMTFGLLYLFSATLNDGEATGVGQFLAVLWLIGFFILRNGWFALFEMGSRGATPGKRLLGLRVVARDGARLTGAAVIARNAMREIEIFLPLSFLADQTAEGTADTFLTIFALLWSGISCFSRCSIVTGCASATSSRERGWCGVRRAGSPPIWSVALSSRAESSRPRRSISMASMSCRRSRTCCATTILTRSPRSPE